MKINTFTSKTWGNVRTERRTLKRSVVHHCPTQKWSRDAVKQYWNETGIFLCGNFYCAMKSTRCEGDRLIWKCSEIIKWIVTINIFLPILMTSKWLQRLHLLPIEYDISWCFLHIGFVNCLCTDICLEAMVVKSKSSSNNGKRRRKNNTAWEDT